MRKHLVAALAVVSALAVPATASTRALHARVPRPGQIITCDLRGCRPETAPAVSRRAGARTLITSRTARHSRRSRKAHRRASYGVSGSPLDGLKMSPGARRTVAALVAVINRKLDRYVRRTGRCGSASEQLATFYWQGRRTANGERFNPHGLTAASRRLPFGTKLEVTNPHNGRSVLIRINDRGPYTKADIDLSLGTARALGLRQSSYVCVSSR